MSRRSERLVSSGYYPNDDDATSTSSTGSTVLISYRESPLRIPKSRTRSRKGASSSRASSQASNVSDFLSPYIRDSTKTDDCMTPNSGVHRRSPVYHSTTSLLSSSAGHAQLDSNRETAGFSSGYSSSEEGYYRPRTNSSCSSAQSPAEAGIGLTEVLRSPARALAMLYFWFATTWYSLTSGLSLLDVFLLSRRTAGMKKAILLFLLIFLLIFGVWYWYPSISASLTQTKASIRPVQHTSHEQIPHVSLLAIKEQINAELHKHKAEWSESRSKDVEQLMREINLLKQGGEKQKLLTERLITDMDSLRAGTKNVESDVQRQWEQEMTGMHSQITGLKEHVSHLQSTSDLLQQRMDTQENQHAEVVLKLELSDWLLKFLSSNEAVSQQNLVKRPDLQSQLEDLEKRLLDRLRQDREEKKTDVWRSVGETLRQEGAGAVTIQDVEQIVRRALSIYRADGIGMADYALESAGASVINTRCSETYRTRAACLSLFGFPLLYLSESPRTVIQPELYPGKCWAFRGTEGFLVISLSYPVHITHVTLEHLPKVLSPTGRIDSAPQDFAVYGMTSENEEGTLLGRFTYDHEGESIQTFKLPDPQEQKIYNVVELRILSNWGHPEYTCVYRFRVHGKPLSS
ncbi:SUN domain-containing protein 2-like [Chanos chanos]|uniref:SUN domain-containing protein 2-like n=1 Tax=Chanos chanos TaxID=29144 RepID=A0A6J2VQQ0_CHACN|nr:SUN domain-containing protein 2-like [Chanos chanos]